MQPPAAPRMDRNGSRGHECQLEEGGQRSPPRPRNKIGRIHQWLHLSMDNVRAKQDTAARPVTVQITIRTKMMYRWPMQNKSIGRTSERVIKANDHSGAWTRGCTWRAEGRGARRSSMLGDAHTRDSPAARVGDAPDERGDDPSCLRSVSRPVLLPLP